MRFRPVLPNLHAEINLCWENHGSWDACTSVRAKAVKPQMLAGDKVVHSCHAPKHERQCGPAANDGCKDEY